MPVLFSGVVLLIMVAALVDIIPRHDAKHLPKIVWIVLVVLMPFVGSLLWFALGREWASAPRWRAPEASAPATVVGSVPPAPPRSTEEQLAALDREIEQAERLRALEAQVAERRAKNGDGHAASELS